MLSHYENLHWGGSMHTNFSDATQKEYNQTLDCIADIVVYTHTVHIIANVVTVIHTANPNCIYCVQSISLAHIQSSGRGGGGGSKQKMNAYVYTYISIPKYFCTTIAADCA